MILTGVALEAAANHVLSPALEPDRASIDVRVSEPVVVEPHSYAVVDSLETVKMPENLAATITGRSSHMRAGVTMPGGVVDPGYEDTFALEFFNHNGEPFELEAGDRGGRLTFMQLTTRPDVAARFWSNVDVRQGDLCWEWQGSIRPTGYGQFRHRGSMRLTHQVAYSIFYHEPGDMHVLHKCDNRSCVNPHHLYLGTNQDNIDDKVERGNVPSGEELWSSKLTESEVSEIRARYKDEEVTQAELASEYGISQSNISRIVNRRHYTASDEYDS